MGGIRCNFRDCRVTTQHYPGLHFFRLPVNDKQRFQKWIKMAGAEHLLELPAEQQKCKLICGRHFRDECFMNYKMDRLVRGKAVPTITRISDRKAYDYEQLDEAGNPKLVELPSPKMAHLIPPDDFPSAFAFNEGDEKYTQSHITNIINEKNHNSDSVSSTESQNDSKTLEESVKIFLEMSDDIDNESEQDSQPLKRQSESLNDSNERPSKSIKIMDIKTISSSQEANNNKNVNVRTTNTASEASASIENPSDLEYESVSSDFISDDLVFESVELTCNSENDDTEFVNKTLYDEMVQHFESLIETERRTNASEIEKLKKENSQLTKDLFKTRLSVGKANDQYNKAKTNINSLTKSNESLTKQIESLTLVLEKNNKDLDGESNELHKLRSEYQNFKKKYEKLLIEHNHLKQNFEKLKNTSHQNDMVTTSKSQMKKNTAVVSNSNAAVNKIQLFNGIKKYLNSSMIALLRMQMFGNSDRDWKTDERQVSVDLLNLGENVYRNFTDEWRFHLPSMNTTKKWLREPVYDDDEDL